MVLASLAAPGAAPASTPTAGTAPAGAAPAGTEGFAAALAQAAPVEAVATPPPVAALPLANAAARQAALKSTAPSRHGGPRREVAEPAEAAVPLASREAEITVDPATGGAAAAKPALPARKREPQAVSAFTAMLLGVAAAPAPPASAAAPRAAPHATAPVTQALAAKAVTAQPETAQAAPGPAAAALPGSPAPIAGGAAARAHAPSPFVLKLTQAVTSVEKGLGPAQPEAVVQPTTQANTALAGTGAAGHRVSNTPTPANAAVRQAVPAAPLAMAVPVRAPAAQTLPQTRLTRAEKPAGPAPAASPPNTAGAAPVAHAPPAAASTPAAGPPGTGAAPAIPATPAALAAAVTALHHSGGASTTLRLDPPGLGQLAIHLALGATGQVNVLFLPTTTQTAQLLHAGMDGLRQAMSQTGLTLGQAQIGGQGSGSQPQQQPQGRQTPETSAAPEAAPAATGLSAYA